MPTLFQDAFTRRQFLDTAAACTAGMFSRRLSAAEPARPRVAVVFTEFRFRSHTYNILQNFFEPYLFSGKLVDPGVEIVSFYADQFPQHDMARPVSKARGIPLFKTIGDALRVGGKELAVDAVLLIGEHGDYPVNKLGQKEYPRKQFFDQIVAAMRQSQRFVPIFNDKHLSYRWDWAAEMYETAREHGIPLLAGSSVPLAQRIPPIDLPAGGVIEEAVSIHGGGVETYDFHGLEVLQSFVESRRGGETGIARVELLTGEAFQAAQKSGRWSRELVEAAMNAENKMGVTRQKRPPRTERIDQTYPLPSNGHAVVVHYTDGLKATVLKVGDSSDRWNFACRIRDDDTPRATALYNGPWGNRCLFRALSHAIQHLFIHRRAPYPVERTLLVSGVLEAAMKSHAAGGKPLETPHLEIAYQPVDFSRFRENGATWRIITPEIPQPTEFVPGDARYIQK